MARPVASAAWTIRGDGVRSLAREVEVAAARPREGDAASSIRMLLTIRGPSAARWRTASGLQRPAPAWRMSRTREAGESFFPK